MKILISACLTGSKVRWNGVSKECLSLVSWAKENKIELVAVCPEDELLGTPRAPIRLIQMCEELVASYRGTNIKNKLEDKCHEILSRHPDAVGFIGVPRSPTCGIGVGVKNLGKVTKGFMHKACEIPSTESAYLKSEKNRERFLLRINKFLREVTSQNETR